MLVKDQVSKKGPADFVTNADIKTEKIIIEELKKARPNYSIISEENGIEKNKDNPVFYCQYAYARASSVINKASSLGINLKSFDKYNQATNNLTKDEIAIILKLLFVELGFILVGYP